MQEVDDQTIRRFLRARELNINKASALFLKFLKWRRTFVPNASISASEVPNEIAQNKMFLQGLDKKRRPIMVVLGARHFQNKGGIEEFKRMFFFPFSLSAHITLKFPMPLAHTETSLAFNPFGA